MSRMTPSRPADHNMLFGVLALQMDFVSGDDLIEAMYAWALSKHKSLGQILCERGMLAPDEKTALDALVEKHIRRHDNNVERSLAAAPVPAGVREAMQGIADPDVQASLACTPSTPALERTGACEARPVPSRRWLGRRRTLAIATAAGLAVMVLSLAAAALLLKIAGDRERSAREGERNVRMRAEENFRLARDAVDASFTKVSDNPQLKATAMEPLRRELLQQAKDFYEKFVNAQGDEPGLQAELGRAYLRLSEITAEMGSRPEAVVLAQKAQNIFDQLASTSSEVAEYQDSLARAFSLLGRNNYGTKDWPKARAAYEKALALREQLVRDHPANTNYRFQLAVSLNDMGKLHRLGLGKAAEGEAFYEKALSLCESLDREHPGVGEYQSERARTLHFLGESQDVRGQRERAREVFAKAVPILDQLTHDHPDVAAYQDQLVETLHDLAIQYSNTRQPKQCQPLCERARAVCDRLVRDHPLAPAYQVRLSRVRVLTAMSLAQLGQHARSVAEVEAVIATNVNDGQTMYNGACAYVLSSQAARTDDKLAPDEREEFVQLYHVRAIELLRTAVGKGLFQIAVARDLLKNDEDLAPLRGREDFKKLLQDVEEQARKRP
jgi:tetratricopeptide (TPR) repeat protein